MSDVMKSFNESDLQLGVRWHNLIVIGLIPARVHALQSWGLQLDWICKNLNVQLCTCIFTYIFKKALSFVQCENYDVHVLSRAAKLHVYFKLHGIYVYSYCFKLHVFLHRRWLNEGGVGWKMLVYCVRELGYFLKVNSKGHLVGPFCNKRTFFR